MNKFDEEHFKVAKTALELAQQEECLNESQRIKVAKDFYEFLKAEPSQQVTEKEMERRIQRDLKEQYDKAMMEIMKRFSLEFNEAEIVRLRQMVSDLNICGYKNRLDLEIYCKIDQSAKTKISTIETFENSRARVLEFIERFKKETS